MVNQHRSGTVPFCLVLALALVAAACSATDQEYAVVFEGFGDIPFTAQCQVRKADGSTSSQTVKSTTTNTYYFKGISIGISAQKDSDSGNEFRVSIKKGGKVIISGATTASYGLVTLSGR